MRVLLRVASAFMLAFAVMAGVIDTVQSFASSAIVMTPAMAVWLSVDSRSYDSALKGLSGIDPQGYLSDLFSWVLDQPAFAVFLAGALIFWILGYKKQRPAGRFAA